MPKQRTEWGIGDPTISVVGERFCNPNPMELLVRRKLQNFKKDRYEVFDISGNLLLQVDGSAWGFQRKRVMQDPAGFTVLTMHEKACEALQMKKKWKVYGGINSNAEDLVFTARQSSALTLKTSLDVFLPHNNPNKKKKVCDFHATGGYSNLAFKVLKDDAVIAGVNHKFSWGSFCKGKYSFRVRVNPEVDYAFIVALLVIIDDNENLY